MASQDELGTEMVGEVSISVPELLDKPGMKIHGKLNSNLRSDNYNTILKAFLLRVESCLVPMDGLIANKVLHKTVQLP